MTASTSLKIVFFGTPFFAAEILQYLFEQKVPICAVVTQPDRPKGRSLKPSPCAVKSLVLNVFPALLILQPERASEPGFLQKLGELQADLFVVVAFGQILPQRLLDLPRYGCINVHPSLLPKYRGAAPIQRAILAGEKETGICVQKMVFQLDAGDVVACRKMQINPDWNAEELEKRLVAIAKPLLLQVLQDCEKNRGLKGMPQEPALVSYAAKLLPKDAEIDWNVSSFSIHHLIRACSPKPGAWCWILLNGVKKKLKIYRSKMISAKLKPKQILFPEAVVGCQEGALELLEVQLEGKKRIKGSEWIRGHRNVVFL